MSLQLESKTASAHARAEGLILILGHHSTAVTKIYAEKDEQQAVKAIMKVGDRVIYCDF